MLVLFNYFYFNLTKLKLFVPLLFEHFKSHTITTPLSPLGPVSHRSLRQIIKGPGIDQISDTKFVFKKKLFLPRNFFLFNPSTVLQYGCSIELSRAGLLRQRINHAKKTN